MGGRNSRHRPGLCADLCLCLRLDDKPFPRPAMACLSTTCLSACPSACSLLSSGATWPRSCLVVLWQTSTEVRGWAAGRHASTSSVLQSYPSLLLLLVFSSFRMCLLDGLYPVCNHAGKLVMGASIAWFSLASALLPAVAITPWTAAAGLTLPAVLAARFLVGFGEGEPP